MSTKITNLTNKEGETTGTVFFDEKAQAVVVVESNEFFIGCSQLTIRVV